MQDQEKRTLSMRPLVGVDGNAFAILASVQAGLAEAGASQEEIDEFYAEATAGDYDRLLSAAIAWTDPDAEEDA